VTDVQPSDIPAREGTIVTVHGSNLGITGPLRLRIGELELQAIAGVRLDDLVQAKLGAVPAGLVSQITDSGLQSRLVVEREHWAPGYKDVTLTKP
jgi:hypothetical protein